jgi:hypothetical protein
VWVDDEALLSDLSLVAGEHLDLAHLDHGLGELDLPRLVDRGVEVDDPGRPGVVEQRTVGDEEDPVRQDVLEVLGVEGRRRDRVEGHHGGVHLAVAGRPRAAVPKVLGVGRVEGRVGPPQLAAEVVEALREGGAVGAADGVRAGERDHVVGGEPLAPEALDELGDVVGRGRDVVDEHLVGSGHAAVAAARGDGVVDAAGEVGAVVGRERHDVGAGDGARAVRLEDGLGVVHHVEAAHAGVVRHGVLLGHVARHGVQEDGAVAAAHEAVVEVHADEPRADARIPGQAALDGVAHDLLGLRARVLVEADLQFRRWWPGVRHRHRGGGGRERRQDDCRCQPSRRPHGGGGRWKLLCFCCVSEN